MAEILLSRYDLFVSKGIPTHVTTNLSASELESKYGNRLRSRMREMFNLVAFDKKSGIKEANRRRFKSNLYRFPPVPRHISLTTSPLPIPVRASRNRSLIQRFGKKASDHPAAKESLSIPFRSTHPQFHSAQSVFFQPTSRPLKAGIRLHSIPNQFAALHFRASFAQGPDT